MLITDDYQTTTKLCEKKLLEGGYAYLITANERWTAVHIHALIRFHKRICFCIMDLIHIQFLKQSSGLENSKNVEAYVDAMLGKCFDLFLPVIGVIQGIVEETEIEQLYHTLEWMEDYKSMEQFVRQAGKYHKANRKLAKMLTKELKEDKQIRDYGLSKEW